MRDPGSFSRALLLALCFSTVVVSACGTGAVPTPEVAPPAGAAAEADPSKDAAESEPSAEEHSNKIKWKTASEVDNFGYDVYRGESQEGPFERINPEVIEGAGTTDEPTAYEYVDRTIDPYKTYFYYVESISMNGVREKFTPVGRAKAKISLEAEPAGEGSTG